MIGVKSVKTYFGTNAERTAIPLSGFLPGDVFVETDTKTTYQHNGMAWIQTAVDGTNYLTIANNLSDLNNAATARANLGLVAGGSGDVWVEKAGDTMTGDLLIPDNRINALLIDSPLVNAGDEGNHFLDNDSSYPDGWTEVDAAAETDTEALYSHWYIGGTNSETSYKYRRKTSTDLETDITASASASFLFGPIYIRDNAYSADIDYYFGVYRDNGGSIDEDTYSRVHLQWDSSGSQWRVRGELKDSTSGTQKTGSWIAQSNPINMPLYFAIQVLNDANKRCIQYYGVVNIPSSTLPANNFMSLLQNSIPTTALTWSDIWLQVHQTRGAGGADRLLIGAIDRIA